MSEVLTATVDKFMFRVPTDRWYTEDGLWVQPIDDASPVALRVGVTDFLQQRSGDVAFVTVRPPGTSLAPGDNLAEIETVKVNLVLPAPFAAEITDSNPALEATPEIVNQDPYGAGWLARVAIESWDTLRRGLLAPEAYLAHMQQQAIDGMAS